MLYLSFVFFIISVITGWLGFGGISTVTGDVARILFFICVSLFVITLLLGLFVFRKARDLIEGKK